MPGTLPRNVLHSDASSEPCYSMRLVRPFLAVLRRFPGYPVAALEPLERLDPDDRLPIAVAHQMTDAAVAFTGDPDLGLKAGREISYGDHGVLDYVGSSAATFGEALNVLGRYARLVNDALDLRVEVEDGMVNVRLDSRVVISRQGADFQAAACYVSILQWSPNAAQEQYPFEVWFTHPRPEDVREYEQTFDPGTVRFGMPFNGFRFSASQLNRPLDRADPKLHALIRSHADMLLAELPKAESLTERVRSILADELAGGQPTAATVARKLHMSTRTLGRRLEYEGTNFRALVDEMRQRLAMRYVRGHELGLSEIAFLLGFSQTAAFHRAFKRWTGRTPLEYRRAAQGLKGA